MSEITHLSIVDLKKNQYDVDIDLNCTVGELKAEMAKQHNIDDPQKIKLILNSHILVDSQILKDLNINESSVIKTHISGAIVQRVNSSSSNSSNDASQSSENSATPRRTATSMPSYMPQITKPDTVDTPQSDNPIFANVDQQQNMSIHDFSHSKKYPIIMQLRKNLIEQGVEPLKVDNFIYIYEEYLGDDIAEWTTFFYDFENKQGNLLSDTNKCIQIKPYMQQWSKLFHQARYNSQNYMQQFQNIFAQYYNAYKKRSSQSKQMNSIKSKDNPDVLQLRKQFGQLSPEQQHDCNVLYAEGYDMDEIVQTYLIYYNIDATRNALNQM